jgi:chromosome transmission fidelity protein 18
LTNIIQIPYIDPTLERCAAAHDYLSSGDVLRQRRLTNQILPICGIIHLLCSVERRQTISFSAKAFADASFKTETNTAMLRKFKEGMVLNQSLSSRSSDGLVRDTIPFVLWALSAGEGSGALTRGTTSEKLLKTNERQSFERHASIMSALGLTYRAKDDVELSHHVVQKTFSIEPPIDDLTFSGLDMSRQEIPSSVSQPCSALYILYWSTEY